MRTAIADPLCRSGVESDRFGLEVYRGRFSDHVPAKEIVTQVMRDAVDVAVLRVPAAEIGIARRFEQRGIPTLVADALVYYCCDLVNHAPRPRHNAHVEIEALSDHNVSELDALVESSFADYTNHYTANPLLAGGLVPGYLEWARSYWAPGDQERRGWLARRGDAYLGFITCRHTGDEAEIVLNAVAPEASGAGVYGDLIRFTQGFFKDLGCRTMKVSTQVQNFAVQKVWSREGFVMDEAYATVHLNALLSASVVPKRTLPLVVTPGEIAEFGRVSGDLNPLHFDDEAAHELGFDGRIAHGIIAAAFLSKFYGTEFPGRGTIFAGFRYSFTRPVYPDRDYSVEISFPYHDAEHGRWTSLARIFDPQGAPCLLAYSDLVNHEAKAG